MHIRFYIIIKYFSRYSMKYTTTSLIGVAGTNFCGIDDVKHFANYSQSEDSTRIIFYIINLKRVTDQKNVKIKFFFFIAPSSN